MSLTFSKQFGTVMTPGEVVRPLGIPGLSRFCGSTTLAANTFCANLKGEKGRQVEAGVRNEQTCEKVQSGIDCAALL